jgi:hypothetical protein
MAPILLLNNQPPTRVKIKMTRHTVCDGRPVKAGDIVETSHIDANYLISIGKAVKYVDPDAPAADAKKNGKK